MCKILNTRGPVAMEDDRAGDAKSGSFTPTPTPTHMEGAFCYFRQTESLDDSHKAGFQVVNNLLEPALFVMFTDTL